MLKFQDFRDKGYSVTRTDKSSPTEKDWATWLIQKKIKGEKCYDCNTKYFINIYISDIRLWDVWGKVKNYYTIRNRRGMTLKLQFMRDNFTFDVSVSNDNEYSSIEDMELLVDELWHNLSADCYGG